MRYCINRDVSCREEAPEEGAILFNPDADVVMVVNATGLLLWHALEQPRDPEELVAHLLEKCEDVPAGQVREHVSAFLAAVLARDFCREMPTAAGEERG